MGKIMFSIFRSTNIFYNFLKIAIKIEYFSCAIWFSTEGLFTWKRCMTQASLTQVSYQKVDKDPSV